MEKAVAGGTAQELDGLSCTVEVWVILTNMFSGIFIFTS